MSEEIKNKDIPNENNAAYTRWFKYGRNWLYCMYNTISPGHIWTNIAVHIVREVHIPTAIFLPNIFTFRTSVQIEGGGKYWQDVVIFNINLKVMELQYIEH
jgi:hypothetical protein